VAIGPEDLTLEGRRAIVTGAANGIGRAIAVTFARFGADVALCDRDEANLREAAAEVEAAGRRAVAGVLDVRDREAVGTWVAGVGDAFGGRVDILVNNAGGGFQAAFAEVSAKGEEALVRENFTSVTNFVRAVLPLMTAGGAIVNVTSIEAHRAAPGYAVYAAMKAAVANLTRSLALELGERMIRVNCVAPDVIPTPGMPGLAEAPVRTPLPRRGHVDDVAAAALFLASDLAGFVTGTTIHVDGGNWAAGGWHRGPDGAWVT
jgi:NAD(P)-dependent dehydrogenase (short-subunit alcohol dehydrogenase family)